MERSDSLEKPDPLKSHAPGCFCRPCEGWREYIRKLALGNKKKREVRDARRLILEEDV